MSHRAAAAASVWTGRGAAARRLRRGLFAVTTAVSLAMAARSQVGGDQLNLLARGWRLAALGELVPYGNPLSGGGVEPGALTSLLVGLPLLAWRDARAPVLAVLACHLAAWVLLDRLVRQAAGERERLLLAVLWGMSPWRLYRSAYLWNPNYLFLAGAAHAWTAWRLRDRPRFGATMAHVATIGLAAQLHPSAAILAFASLLLSWRGLLRLSWPGTAAGAAVAAATLMPWLAAAADPALRPGSAGFPGRGLLLAYPLVRGLGYLLRYGSLATSSQLLLFDFSTTAPHAGAALGRAAHAAVLAVAAPSVLLPLLAWRRLLARPHRWLARRPAAAPAAASTGGGRAWLAGYCRWTAAGAAVAFALAPTTVMDWQAIPAFHAAVLPPVLLLAAAARRPRWRRAVGRTAGAWATIAAVIAALTLLGSPHYRCGGKPVMGLGLALAGRHPMLSELGLDRRCPFRIDPGSGWWPDVLPRPGPSP